MIPFKCVMAESIMRMPQSDIVSLKEALRAQQELLQKLYNELDVEREASSTAASEALSMILRLQGEKAAVKMEAEQYKRLTEEKICHAEEALAIFEDLICQKELEIAALDYQVQSYRYKLISMGCINPGVGEIKFPENLLQRDHALVGDTGVHSLGRRNSAPPVPPKYFKKGTIERERSASPDKNAGEEINDQNIDVEKKSDISAVGDINSYWQEIRKLDERVKEITGVYSSNLRVRSKSPSVYSQESTGTLYDPTEGAKTNDLDELKHPENLLENETTTDFGCSSTAHDVFEVPQTHENHKVSGLESIEKRKLLEGVKSCVKEENCWPKKKLMSRNRQNSLLRPGDGVAVDCHCALVCPTIGISESIIHHLNQKPEIIEVERQAGRQEATNIGEEELTLLHEIRGQLNSIQSEIRSLKTKKAALSEELSLNIVKEAMLHFWL